MAISEPITVSKVMGGSDWPGLSYMLILKDKDGVNSTRTTMTQKRSRRTTEQLREDVRQDQIGKIPLAKEIKDHVGKLVTDKLEEQG